MSLTGFVHLTENLLNSISGPGPAQPGTPPAKPAATGAPSPTANEDRFVPSAQNPSAADAAQEAGLFSVTQLSVFSAAAELLLAQAATLLTNPGTNTTTVNAGTAAETTPGAGATATGAAASTATGAGTALLAPSTTAPNGTAANAGTQAAVSAGAAAATTAATTAPSPVAATASANAVASSITSSSNTQAQLLTLNAALVALGLNAQEIAQIDQIAGIVNDFSPLAYTSLVYQLEAAAQAAAAQQAGTSPATATNGPAGNSQAATPVFAATNTSATPASISGGAFQLQGLVIRFSGVQVTTNTPLSNAQGLPANTSQTTAFNLQIEEVNLALVNHNGQSLVLQATPQAAAPANGTAGGATQAVAPKALAAKA